VIDQVDANKLKFTYNINCTSKFCAGYVTVI